MISDDGCPALKLVDVKKVISTSLDTPTDWYIKNYRIPLTMIYQRPVPAVTGWYITCSCIQKGSKREFQIQTALFTVNDDRLPSAAPQQDRFANDDPK